jgi:hypothetical protein
MPTSSSGRAKNKLPYGVCMLRVHNSWCFSTFTARSRSTAALTNPAGSAERGSVRRHELVPAQVEAFGR